MITGMKRERRCREIVLNACLNGKLSYLKKAYENGDVDSKMLSDVIENGKTPLFLAASAGHLNVVKFLAEEIDEEEVKPTKGESMTPLHIACFNNHLKIARILYSKFGYSVDRYDSHGYLPLHYAPQDNHSKINARMQNRKLRKR